jgi:hypothetical protein
VSNEGRIVPGSEFEVPSSEYRVLSTEGKARERGGWELATGN